MELQFGPRQKDGHSCGVFVLNAIRCLLNEDTLPASFNEPVQTLLSLLPAPSTETEAEAGPELEMEETALQIIAAPDTDLIRKETLTQTLRDRAQLLARNVAECPAQESLTTLKARLENAQNSLLVLSEENALAEQFSVNARRHAALVEFFGPIFNNDAAHADLPDDQFLADVMENARFNAENALARVCLGDETEEELVERLEAIATSIEQVRSEVAEVEAAIAAAEEWSGLIGDVEKILEAARERQQE